jgi:hypothetical protein
LKQELKNKAKEFLKKELNLSPNESTPYTVHYVRVVELLCKFYELAENESRCICEQEINVSIDPIESYTLKVVKVETNKVRQ